MPDRKSSSTSNSSRTAAKVAVVVLIVIAIAGFVLAGLKAGKSAPEQVAAADPTQEPAVAPTAAAMPAATVEPAVPGHIVAFAPASSSLAEKELAKVRTMAETAKKKNREVQIVSTAEVAQFGLAQQRANLIRQTLEQGGVPLARMTIKISQVPQGTVSATEANRVAMVLQ